MSEDVKQRIGPERTRSTGFPVVPLEEGIRVVREAARYGTEHGKDAFAGYLGLSSSNSGAFFRKLASLRDFGLVTTHGDRVILTDLGKAIGLPLDDVDAQAAIRQAFLNASTFRVLFENSAKGTPLDPVALANRAVVSHGVSAASKEAFAKSFADSARTAGLGEIAPDGRITLIGNGAKPLPASKSTRPSAGGSSSGTPVLRQSWPLPGGSIVFEIFLDRPLPPRAFTDIQQIVAATQALADQFTSDGLNDSVDVTR